MNLLVQELKAKGKKESIQVNQKKVYGMIRQGKQANKQDPELTIITVNGKVYKFKRVESFTYLAIMVTRQPQIKEEM